MNDNPFADRLLAGERIVWAGRPSQGLLFTPRDAMLIPFSLVWCGFAIFWTVTASGGGAPIFFTLWGLMFVCIGLFFVAGRFLFDSWIRGGVRYALTDRRILILKSGPFSNFTAASLRQLPNAQLSERADGRGTIRFGSSQSLFGQRGMGIWLPSLDPTPQFLAIEGARRVFDQIQRAQASGD